MGTATLNAKRMRGVARAAIGATLIGISTAALAILAPEGGGRFASLVKSDPDAATDVATMRADALPSAARAGWDGFKAAYGSAWSISLDRRSGAPLLVEGPGIPWPVAPDATIDSIAATLRPFIAAHRSLLMADDAELSLNRAASGRLAPDVWQISFDRAVAGVPVAGERYLFTIGHGRLIAFGSPRWSRIDASPVPELDEAAARTRLNSYTGLTGTDVLVDSERPQLQLVPLRAGKSRDPGSGYFKGAIGSGYASALVWRFAVSVAGEPGRWVGLVDAHSGAIRSFTDANHYVRAKGGVYPASNDQNCPSGCERANTSLPFADIAVNGVPQGASSSMGNYSCSSSSIARTTLAGPYVQILDDCGPILRSASCATDIDLGTSTGTDCTVPTAQSAGDTHAARTSFHHLNRMAEHARAFLPSIAWLTQQFTATVNIAQQQCLGGWIDGGIFLGASGSVCTNAGELPGVLDHEWAHGLDENDGGGWDTPTEGYADITSALMLHEPCVGRGFIPSSAPSCTGARELDWDQLPSHTPYTPSNYLAASCGIIGPDNEGPCGYEQHCEGQVSGQALWDLAARDLPAMGLDANTAWSVVDRLWYESRLGSGGNAYNCALPDSDSCLATSWYQKMRLVDDDDGNLANGTPHAAAIFAAFDRHALACGAAGDAINQNFRSCAALGAPTLTAVPGSASATADLSWTAVPGVVSYRVYRNDAGCDSTFTRYATTGAHTTTDADLANGVPIYYTVQAITTNEACDGPISNCVAVTPKPSAGVLRLNSALYHCASVITVTVTDTNGGASAVASLTSTTEAAGQSITLTRIAPGSYRGTIMTTSAPPAADGLLSVQNGDTISATYIDANDGGGGVNVPRTATAAVSCGGAGAALPVADGSFGATMKAGKGNPAATTLNVTWDVATCSSTDHHILYGDLGSVSTAALIGAVCDIGVSGSTSWTGVPAGSLWFVVVGDDGGTTEGSWGTQSGGIERGGIAASGQCGMAARDNSRTCP